MKIVCISDTHERHGELAMPEGDVLVHAGDFTYQGDEYAMRAFNDWLATLPYKHKIVTWGNHELTVDPDHPRYREGYDKLITHAIVLNDSGCEIDGVKFWGSPITPWFQNWAFNRMRGKEIQEHWCLIPEDTDVLITHGPPYGVLDAPFGKMPSVGCTNLAATVLEKKPKLHVFGHIHGNYGDVQMNGTRYVNASVVGEDYRVRNAPIVVELPSKS